jgi:hypothetical protein
MALFLTNAVHQFIFAWRKRFGEIGPRDGLAISLSGQNIDFHYTFIIIIVNNFHQEAIL